MTLLWKYIGYTLVEVLILQLSQTPFLGLYFIPYYIVFSQCASEIDVCLQDRVVRLFEALCGFYTPTLALIE